MDRDVKKECLKRVGLFGVSFAVMGVIGLFMWCNVILYKEIPIL
jgi:hypothetical protein